MEKFSNYFRYFSYRVSKTPNKIYLFDDQESFTYSRCFRVILSYIHQLKEAGVNKNTSVAFRIDRNVDSIFLLYALLAIGSKVYLCDIHVPVKEFISSHQLRDVSFLLSEEFSSLSQFEIVSEKKVPLFRKEEDYAYSDDSDGINPDLIIFTSGSTSVGKAVRQSQSAFINNSLATYSRGGYSIDDINMLFLPLNHVFGLSLVFTALTLDHAVYLPLKVDLPYLVQAIIKNKVTRLNGVPFLYLSLVKECEEKGLKITTLRCGLIGGGPYTKEQFEEIEEKLHMKLISIYGMSEIMGIALGDYNASKEMRSLGVGKIYDGVELKINDGQILVKGTGMMKGYENSDIPSFDEEGYIPTGDMGHFDENGILYLDGRCNKVIIRKGVNISAGTIEQALNSLPYVFYALVLPKKDELCGEVPYAFVSLKEDVDEQRIKEDIKGKLYSHEMPVRIEILKEMPLLPNGKINQRLLQEKLNHES